MHLAPFCELGIVLGQRNVGDLGTGFAIASQSGYFCPSKLSLSLTEYGCVCVGMAIEGEPPNPLSW